MNIDSTIHKKDTLLASQQQLFYLYSLAENAGMDAEALSFMTFCKDLADLSKSEAESLIGLIKGQDVRNSSAFYCG